MVRELLTEYGLKGLYFENSAGSFLYWRVR
jgi:hypothetical protein